MNGIVLGCNRVNCALIDMGYILLEIPPFSFARKVTGFHAKRSRVRILLGVLLTAFFRIIVRVTHVFVFPACDF